MIAILLCLALCASAFTEEENRSLWQKFTQQYNKVYEPSEYYYRYKVFCANLAKIEAHNALGKSYTMGMNEFGDLTWDEFRASHLSPSPVRSLPLNTVSLNLEDIPEEIDWVEKGMVTPVKNQGQCGSCWAFSAVAAMETTYGLGNKKPIDLSEQELVDCSKSYGNEGCNGGLMDYAFKYVIDKKGIASDKDYPYKARDQQCNTKPKKVPHTDFKEFVDVPENNTDELKAACATTAISVAIEADQYQFQFYSGGVFDDECGTNLDHGVTLVGYGHDEESDKDFWKVKNSWGASWGESGYIRMIRKDGESDPGICGICMAASYIPVKKQ
jgi:C1A family cysteine protease